MFHYQKLRMKIHQAWHETKPPLESYCELPCEASDSKYSWHNWLPLPKRWIHWPRLNHTISHLSKCYVLSFGHTILLRGVGHWKLMLKTMFKAKIPESLVHVLPPLSMCIFQIERPDYFSTNVLKTQNESKTSNLYLSREVINESKHIYSTRKGVGNDMRSLWINSNGGKAWVARQQGKRSLCCLPREQPWKTPSV